MNSYIYRSQVRGQTLESLKEHDPVYCEPRFKDWGKDPRCPQPQFAGSAPGVSWLCDFRSFKLKKTKSL